MVKSEIRSSTTRQYTVSFSCILKVIVIVLQVGSKKDYIYLFTMNAKGARVLPICRYGEHRPTICDIMCFNI